MVREPLSRADLLLFGMLLSVAGAGGPAGLGEEHQRQQPGHLTVLRHEGTD